MNLKACGALVSSGTVLALAGAVTVAPALVALPARAQPSRTQRPATSTGWRVSASVSLKGQQTVAMADVDADSGGDAWAVGVAVGKGSPTHLVIEHWAGKTWRPVRPPVKLVKVLDSGASLIDTRIGATSPRDVWVFSGNGRYLRLAGRRWTSGRLPRPKTGVLVSQAVKVFSPDDVWVFGCRAHSQASSPLSCKPFAARFNGRSWRVFHLSGRGFLSQVSALSPDDIWAIRGSAQLDGLQSSRHPQVVRWNGKAWRVAPVQPKVPAKAQLSAIVALSDTDVWVGGAAANSKQGSYELFRHWNGRAWVNASPAAKPSSDQPFVIDLVPDGTGGIWELAFDGARIDTLSRLRHFSHGRWLAPTDVSWLLLRLAPAPGTDSTWGAGASQSVSRGLIVLHGPKPH